jgi:hypothetical protein
MALRGRAHNCARDARTRIDHTRRRSTYDRTRAIRPLPTVRAARLQRCPLVERRALREVWCGAPAPTTPGGTVDAITERSERTRPERLDEREERRLRRAALRTPAGPVVGVTHLPIPVWSQIASRPSAIALYPRSLSRSAAAMLVRERLGDEADDEFCLACHMATGGNPLFLQELLRALEAAQTIPSAAAAGDIEAVGPAAVSRFILHRLAALGPGPTDLARAVAVLGDDSALELAPAYRASATLQRGWPRTISRAQTSSLAGSAWGSSIRSFVPPSTRISPRESARRDMRPWPRHSHEWERHLSA